MECTRQKYEAGKKESKNEDTSTTRISWSVNGEIIESLQLEKTTRIIKSNRQSITVVPIKHAPVEGDLKVFLRKKVCYLLTLDNITES